eukprot:PhM_4_TR12642/c0_g1_i1/m.24164
MVMRCVGPIRGLVSHVRRSSDELQQRNTVWFRITTPRNPEVRTAHDNYIECRLEDPWATTCLDVAEGDDIFIEGFHAEPGQELTSPYVVVVNQETRSEVRITRRVTSRVVQESVGPVIQEKGCTESTGYTRTTNTYHGMGGMYYDALFGSRRTSISVVEEDSYFSFMTKVFNMRRKILDVGCGTGLFTFMLRHYGFNPLGLDISVPMIDTCRRKNTEFQTVDGREPCTFVQGDIRSFDLAAQFEGVLCIDVINHLRSVEEVRHAVRCVNMHTCPNGMMIITARNPGAVRSHYCPQPKQEHCLVELSTQNRRLGSTGTVPPGSLDVITRRYVVEKDHTLVTEWHGFCVHRAPSSEARYYTASFSDTSKEILIDLPVFESILTEEGFEIKGTFRGLGGGSCDLTTNEMLTYVCWKPPLSMTIPKPV